MRKVRLNQNKTQMLLLRIIVILFLVYFILFGILFISYCNNGFHWGKASIFGYRAYYVPTESMEPTIPARSFLLTKRISAEYVKEGDIIVYEKSHCYIVHRVVKKLSNGSFLLKGDNNKETDPIVEADQIIGKVIRIL